ncbi:MAG: glutathione peroxidase [Paludibacter sp.]|nr:glutathione peroxidase [Paludibacter sp.]
MTQIKLFAVLIILFVLAGNISSQSIYPFEVVTIDGEKTTLEQYKGKVVLIVNVASKCGLTKQYEGLEAIYKKYKDRGLVILGFPCNQFMGQEPGTESEIAEFCSVNYGVTFPLFSKIEVNGEDAHPLYQFLKKELPGTGNKSDIEWNFAKFLIDKNGKPVLRYHPRVKPVDLEGDIEKLL